MSDIQNKIKLLQDSPHLHRIREALHKGHAAIMVGAGFSRNAKNGGRLPTWIGLSKLFADKLYPDPNDHAKAMKRVEATSGALRLAEEFSAVYGRSALDDTLRQALPDSGQVFPGNLHFKLLEFPWVDIFTINYDTLLERAYEDSQKELMFSTSMRRYQIVVAPKDLPFSRADSRPRIVKLHGSFRSNRPFIITEEDYRCYPNKFAPFVNLVQQSMLENVFCLIGFSGDDPNFLQWSGWIRDRLGTHTPPIYFITVNPLPAGQRLILESRHIYPVVIRDLGTDDLSGEVDYPKAYGALFEFLQEKRPKSPYEWPFQPHNVKLGPNASADDTLSYAAELRQTRMEYPGWLCPPVNTLDKLWNRLRAAGAWYYRAYLKHKESMNGLLRLAILYEVNWLFENSLISLDDNFAKEFIEILDHTSDTVFNIKQLSAEITTLPEIWRQKDMWFREAWQTLGIAMLRYHREYNAADAFRHWQERLNNIPTSWQTEESKFSSLYQNILFALEHFDHVEAAKLIKTWPKSEGCSYWAIRHSALLAEIGEADHAIQIGLAALRQIRFQIQTDGETPRLLSYEQWAELLLEAIQEARKWERTGSEQNKEQEFIIRDEELKNLIDHPWQIIRNLRQDLESAPALSDKKIDFDHPFYSGLDKSQPELKPAFRMARLVEVAAFVPRIGRISLSGGSLVDCVKRLSLEEPFNRYIGLILRSLNDHIFKEVLSSYQIALIPEHIAVELFKALQEKAEYWINLTKDNTNEEKIRILSFAFEFMSRLVIRLPSDKAGEALKLVTDWYRKDGITSSPFLFEEFGHLFKRALKSTPLAIVRANLLNLLSLPPLQEKQIPFVNHHWRDWPEPVECIPDTIDAIRSSKDWDSLAQSLVDNLSTTNQENVQARYLRRIHWLLENGLLQKKIKNKFSDFVWRDVQIGSFPQIPEFYLGVLMVWPTPPDIDVKALLKQKLLNSDLPFLAEISMENGQQRTTFVMTADKDRWLVNLAIAGNEDTKIIWSKNEVSLLVQKIYDWWTNEGHSLCLKEIDTPSFGGTKHLLSQRLNLVGKVILRGFNDFLAALATSLNWFPDWIEDLIQTATKMGYPLPELSVARLHWKPADIAYTSKELLASLQSEDTAIVKRAGTALNEWLEGWAPPKLCPSELFLWAVTALWWRKSPQTLIALQLLREMASRELLDQHFAIKENILTGLNTLRVSLRYPPPITNAIPNYAIPDYRLECAELVVALCKHYPVLKDTNELKAWIEEMKKDPLAEVRNEAAKIS